MDEENKFSATMNKQKEKTEAKYFNERLNQNQTRHLWYFFFMPITFITLGIVLIIAIIISAIQVSDYTGLLSFIWFNIQFWVWNALISLAIGIIISLICEFAFYKLRKTQVLGRLRRFLRKKSFFPFLYAVPIIILGLMVAPINILFLYLAEVYTFIQIRPLISIPIVVIYLIYCLHLLISPPYDTVGDLIDEGKKIHSLLKETKLQDIIEKKNLDEDDVTPLYLWQNVDSFFLKLNDYLEDRINTGIHDFLGVTADIMMIWTNNQPKNLNYVLNRFEKIIKAVENKEIVILTAQLEELITKSKTATMKFEGVLDYKKSLEETLKKPFTQKKWYRILQFTVYILIPLIYFVIKLVEIL